jgi:hypothetical protein
MIQSRLQVAIQGGIQTKSSLRAAEERREIPMSDVPRLEEIQEGLAASRRRISTHQHLLYLGYSISALSVLCNETCPTLGTSDRAGAESKGGPDMFFLHPLRTMESLFFTSSEI